MTPFILGEDVGGLRVHALYLTLHRKAVIERKLDRQRRGAKLGNLRRSSSASWTASGGEPNWATSGTPPRTSYRMRRGVNGWTAWRSSSGKPPVSGRWATSRPRGAHPVMRALR